MAVCEVICTVTRYLRIERHRSRIMHGISASFPRYTGRCARGRGHRGFERTSRGLPGGKALSFASPKESTQRKGDPRFVALRVPSAAHKRGPLRNSWLESAVAQKVEFVLATQTVLADIPAFAPLLGNGCLPCDSHVAPTVHDDRDSKKMSSRRRPEPKQNNVNLDPGLRRDDSDNGLAGSR